MPFTQMIKRLVGNSGATLKNELQTLCNDRWVIAVQAHPDQRAEKVIGGLVGLLESCGYNPSYAWFDHQGVHHKLVSVQQSPFMVILLPSNMGSQVADGLTIHTLVRDANAPNHVNGIALHPLAKVVVLAEDKWALQQFALKENISQFVSLTHNTPSSIGTAQQLITAAGLHIGVLESVSEDYFSHYTNQSN
jgi:hypothetical protein